MTFPKTAQEAFTAIVKAGKVPWRPADPEAHEVYWMQLVTENWVPSEFANLIDSCDRIFHNNPSPDDALRRLATRYKLEFPACTP